MFLEIFRFNFEWNILEWLNKCDLTIIDYFFYFISQLGGSIGILILMTIIYWCINKEKGVKVGYISVLGINLNGIFKSLFLAKRPFQYLGKEHLRKLEGSSLSDGASGTSFPSGHSQNTATLYSSIVRYFKKNWVIIISVLMMILVPLSRVYLGVHFPGDVVVGTTLGIITTIIFGFIIDKFYHKKFLVFIITASCLSPFLFLPNMGKDFYKGMGILCGFILGIYLEEKYVNFEVANGVKINIIRYLFGGAVMLITYLGAHLINHLDVVLENEFLLRTSNLITHCIIAVVAIYFVPYLFKKIPFLKGN